MAATDLVRRLPGHRIGGGGEDLLDLQRIERLDSASKSSATMPATCGVAIEVPLMCV